MAARAPGRNPDHISTSRAWAACLLLCAAVPMADSPNRPTPESPRCPTPDAACARSNRHSPNSRPCPIRRRWTTRRRGRAGTIRRSRWRRTAACARLPAAGQSPRRHRRVQTQLADLNGSEQDLTGLRAAADRITRYYHDQGLSARARLSSAAGNPRRRGRHRRTGRRVRRDPARQPVARERRGVAPGTVRAAARRSRAHRQSGKPPAAPERPARRRSARHATRGRAPRLQHAAGQRRAHAAGHRQHRRRQLRRLLHRRIPPGRQPGREQPAAPGRPTQPAPANQRPQAALYYAAYQAPVGPPSPAWA